MTIIIRDQLVSPPTWFASFRDLTLLCKVILKESVVIESDDPDPYYRWLKRLGGMDFVDQFVRPETEQGIRLDSEWSGALCVVTDRIAVENVGTIFGRIRALRGPRKEIDPRPMMDRFRLFERQ